MKKKRISREDAHETPMTLYASTSHMGADYEERRSKGTEDWLLIVTIGGSGKVSTGGEPVISTKGTVTLYQPGVRHLYGTEKKTGHWHLKWSHFYPQPQWGKWLSWPEHTRGLRMIQISDAFVFRKVTDAMADVERFVLQQYPEGMDLAVNSLERALIWINSVDQHRHLDARVRHAIDVLAKASQEEISVPDLAKVCGMSVSRLAHLFREQTGMAPRQYLEEVRLQRAMQLLRSGGMRVGEVADECGFASAFYFSNRFRRKFGQSPSAYRKEVELKGRLYNRLPAP
ncbi:MAG: helix-turn-helix domain-containing protein [Chthoniobacterales bacterium]